MAQKNEKLQRPNFYHIPTIVAERVKPHEAFVFSVVYWFEKMKDGRCFASNKTIAEALPYASSQQSVANALTALEDLGFIKRIFSDPEKRIRSEIIVLVDYGVSPTGEGGITHRFRGYNPQMNRVVITNNNIGSQSSPSINHLLKLFEGVDVKNKRYYGRKDQREACDFLIKEHGLDFVEKLIALYIRVRDTKTSMDITYLPEIYSPKDMVEKWGKLETFFKKEKDKKNKLMDSVIF